MEKTACIAKRLGTKWKPLAMKPTASVIMRHKSDLDVVRQASHAEVGKDGACGNDQSELADPDQRIIGIVGNGWYVGG